MLGRGRGLSYHKCSESDNQQRGVVFDWNDVDGGISWVYRVCKVVMMRCSVGIDVSHSKGRGLCVFTEVIIKPDRDGQLNHSCEPVEEQS